MVSTPVAALSTTACKFNPTTVVFEEAGKLLEMDTLPIIVRYLDANFFLFVSDTRQNQAITQAVKEALFSV